MPRLPRKTPGGLIYHVTNRAADGGKLFARKTDYPIFHQALADALQQHPAVRLLGYCALPNHWHLILLPRKDDELGAFMQRLTLTHVRRMRVQRKSVGSGSLYESRFRSFPVQADAHLQSLLRYVEHRPVQARLTRRAQDWQWSSLALRCSRSAADKEMLSAPPIRFPANWLTLVNRAQDAAETAAIETCLTRNRPYGEDAWVRRIAQRLNLTPTLRPIGRPRKNSKK